MTTLTLRFINGHFVVTGPDIEPMKFKSRREAKDWCRWHHPRVPIIEIGGIGPGGWWRVRWGGREHRRAREHPSFNEALDSVNYVESQRLGYLRAQLSEGLAYPSQRHPGECVGLFYPDRATLPIQGRHMDYHWDGTRVNMWSACPDRVVRWGC